MARLTKDAWAKPSLRTKEVEVEELGGSVLVRELPAEYSAEVASNFEMRQVGRDQVARVDTATMERLQFAYGVIDDQGAPMFTEDEAAQVAKDHGRAFKTVIAVIDELSGIDKEAIKDAAERFPGQREGAGRADLGNGVPGGDSGPAVPARVGIRAREDDPGDDLG